jgi:hypothetical protein
LFFAPLSVAIAIKGFAAGLDPPAAGCTWRTRIIKINGLKSRL